MEPRIKAMFTPEILDEAKRRFGIDRLETLDGFENFIYEYQCPDGDRILRIAHDQRHSLAGIEAEIAYIDHMAAGGVGACQAVSSLTGRRVETIPAAEGNFLAVSFQKAPGEPPSPVNNTPARHRAMGATMGRMHVLTKQLPPLQRPTWYDEIENMAEKYLGPGEEDVIRRFHENCDQVAALPVNSEVFGLVHSDFHGGNYFIDHGKFHLFDFDDCQYHWFAADIAISLFYALPHHFQEPEQHEQAREFFVNFMAGYTSENNLPREWLERIPLFLKQREIDLYIIIRRSFPDGKYDPWVARFMTDRQTKIKDDIPYWERFAELCL